MSKIRKLAYIFILILIITPYSLKLENCRANNSYMNHILVTGFEPFNKYEINPSQLIAENLSAKIIEGYKIVCIILPVNFEEPYDIILQAIIEYKPEIIISLGLSPVAESLEFEKLGLNIKSTPKTQNKWLNIERIDQNGKMIYVSNTKILEIIRQLENEGYSTKISFSAGTYVCNFIYYKTLEYLNKNDLPTTNLFIHLPLLKIQNSISGMDFQTMLEAVRKTIEYTINQKNP